MENIIESQRYILEKNEEEFHINNINFLLNNFESILKNDSDEKNHEKILNSSMICEYMLNLLLKKEGYLIKDNSPLSQINKFCIEKQIIPKECNSFLNTIITYRNNTAHRMNIPNELVSSFLNAFRLYITWFNQYYKDKYKIENPFKIEKCCLMINSNNDLNKFKLNNIGAHPNKNISYSDISYSRNSKPKRQKDSLKSEISKFKNKMFKDEEKLETKNKVKVQKSKINIRESFNQVTLNLILEQLEQQNESIKQIFEVVLDTLEIVQDINAKIDVITNNLEKVQSHSEKLIKNAQSQEEIERIIQIHTDECIENIFEYKNDLTQEDQYLQEKIKLEDKFEDAWNKLSDDSKTFLITSKFLYTKLLTIDEAIDYSGICVLVTKALEVEIFKRFFTDFLKYLNEKYHKDYSKYHTALLFKNRTPLNPKSFTMGNIAFVLCYTENWHDSEEQKRNNKSKLIEYCKNSIFSKYDDEKIEELLNCYASSIEKIRVKYRNPSAHRGQIKRKNAKECFDLVIDVEELLKKMLDSFDK